ncbi:hypothetical protein ABVT39_006338 [Epinephelus coioides]
MLPSQRRTRCREITGPTPHSVAVRAKFPSQRPADQLILDRQKQDAARDKVLDFAKSQRSCDIKTSWLKSSERRFLTGTIERQVRAALDQQKVHVDERRDRLRVLLEMEEQQLLQEMEEKTETLVERQAKMRQQVKALRDRRERDRQQLVSDKLEQLFRGQCEELRSELMRRREQQVCQERAAQVRSGQEQQRLQQQEERMFDELWEADRRAKVDRETERAQRQQQRNRKQLDVIRSQMEEAEQQRQRSRELRAEEAALMLQQQQMQRLQQQRQQQMTLQQQQGRRRQLDQCLRLKMKRLAREQQDELQLDMNILQTLLQQETDDKQEAAHKKAELREEQRRYRQYLSEELQKQRREEEETEQLMEEKLKEVWAKREEQSRLQREARNRLMEEVMEARRLQIQHKLDLNTQKQAELSAERDELNRVMEEMKLMEEEDRRCQKQSSEAFQADLKAQIEAQQRRRSEQRAQEEREQQQGVILQQLYEQRKDHILSRPTSHTSAPHPFRRTEGCTRVSWVGARSKFLQLAVFWLSVELWFLRLKPPQACETCQANFAETVATLDDFLAQPCEDVLEDFTKEQLLQLASSYDIEISNDDKKLKKNIKDSIKKELMSRGVLKPSPPAAEFVMPVSPVASEAAIQRRHKELALKEYGETLELFRL